MAKKPILRLKRPRITTMARGRNLSMKRNHSHHGDAKVYATRTWKQVRAELIDERGRNCEDARHQGPRYIAPPQYIYCDHIVELQDGGGPFDKSNLKLCCASCHQHKTIAARIKRRDTDYGATLPGHGSVAPTDPEDDDGPAFA